MKTKIKQAIPVLLVFLVLFSCEKEKDKAPEIPPVETMVIDYGNLTNADKSAASPENLFALSNVNWLYSVTTVGVWSALIGVTFAVPVAAFRAAFNQLPERTGYRTWEWAYTVDGLTGQYSARLVGQQVYDEIEWEMYISKSGVGAFDEFLWFDGNSALDGNSGEWMLYHSPEFPEEVIYIDWQRENGEVNALSYAYIRELNNEGESDDFNGSYIFYGLKEPAFDAYVIIHAYSQQQEAFVNTNIEWSRVDYSGRVKAEHFYGDADWHCWDTEGNDTDCYE